MQLWDTAGHERFRTITTSYYRGAHGIATVFDLTDRQTFEHVEKWMEEINKYAKENVMRFLIGNKSDLVDKRQVTYEEVRALANKLNIYYVETSAKNNVNITDFFRIATQNYLNKYNFVFFFLLFFFFPFFFFLQVLFISLLLVIFVFDHIFYFAYLLLFYKF